MQNKAKGLRSCHPFRKIRLLAPFETENTHKVSSVPIGNMVLMYLWEEGHQVRSGMESVMLHNICISSYAHVFVMPIKVSVLLLPVGGEIKCNSYSSIPLHSSLFSVNSNGENVL